MKETLTATYTIDPGEIIPEGVKKIILEQEDWEPHVGLISDLQMTRYLGNYIFGNNWIGNIDCGLNVDDEMEIDIHAYPYDRGLNYVFHASYGTFAQYKNIEIIEHEQFISIQGKSFEELEYPCDGLKEYTVLGRCYDINLNEISPPSFDFEGIYVSTTQPVFVALKAKYNVFRHNYKLVLSPRDEGEENYFSSVVYAVYTGGIEWMEIRPAPNSDKFAADGTCGGRYDTQTNFHPKPYEPPEPDKADRLREYDYCSGDLTKDTFS